nr:hypothetical protein [Terriglobales bacterium]
MNRILAFGIPVITVLLVALAWIQSGGVEQHQMQAAQTPEEAVRLLLTDTKNHDWDKAHARLANAADIDEGSMIRELSGRNGSLRSLSSLESFDVWGLHHTETSAKVRAKLHFATAVGPLDDIRDFDVEHSGNVWKVTWPNDESQKLAPQVIPVNYLRWDVINRGAEDDWGVQNVDAPQVRIVSMNAIQEPDRIVILGEIVNEDTVPAYVNVSATLLDGNQN